MGCPKVIPAARGYPGGQSWGYVWRRGGNRRCRLFHREHAQFSGMGARLYKRVQRFRMVGGGRVPAGFWRDLQVEMQQWMDRHLIVTDESRYTVD